MSTLNAIAAALCAALLIKSVSDEAHGWTIFLALALIVNIMAALT